MGELVASLPPGSALCAGSCCGGGLLYGSLGLIVYGGALVTSGFFGLGLGLLGATGACLQFPARSYASLLAALAAPH